MNAINALRETFRDQDHIRVHPIITEGGYIVNSIPERSRIESYVREVDFESIFNANRRVNRALVGAAISVGANVEINDISGYAPLINDCDLSALSEIALKEVLPNERMRRIESIGTGSTDMGDLSCIMPVIQPYCPGALGTAHGSDYLIVDPERACISNAEFQLDLLFLLLENGGERAKNIVSNYNPRFASSDEYFNYIDSIALSGDRIIYNENAIIARC